LIWAKRKGKLRRGVNLRLNCAFEVRIEEGGAGDRKERPAAAFAVETEEMGGGG
jgi:hypothetical protein